MIIFHLKPRQMAGLLLVRLQDHWLTGHGQASKARLGRGQILLPACGCRCLSREIQLTDSGRPVYNAPAAQFIVNFVDTTLHLSRCDL